MQGDELQVIGEQLRQARERLALSIQEAESQTRIRKKFLEGLENGDLSSLPSPTHAKGFLRNYALFLGLDANALVDQFAQGMGVASRPMTTLTAQPRPPAPPLQQSSATGQPPGSTDRDALSQQAPIPYPPYPGVATTGQTSRYVGRKQQSGPGTPSGYVAPPDLSAVPYPQAGGRHLQPMPDHQEAPDTPNNSRRILMANLVVVAVLLIGLILISLAVLTQLSKVSLEGIEQADSSGVDVGITGPTLTPVLSIVPTDTPGSGDSGPVVLDRVVLTMAVTQRTWTRIIVDGETQFEGQTEPGTVLQYEGQFEIQVVTGNGAGLDVTYNGQAIGLLGERGEVVNRTFTSSGEIISPTATPTITITPSPVPSPTLAVTATSAP